MGFDRAKVVIISRIISTLRSSEAFNYKTPTHKQQHKTNQKTKQNKKERKVENEKGQNSERAKSKIESKKGAAKKKKPLRSGWWLSYVEQLLG